MAAELSDVFEGLAEPLQPRVVPFEHRADARTTPEQRPTYARPPLPFEWARDFKDEDGQLHEIVEGLLTAGAMFSQSG